jgi:hypothetical protein
MEQQMGGFEDMKVASANQMQMELASMHGQDFGDFIDTKAEEFRNIVRAHPEFLNEYQTAPEETLKKIEPLLYH